jgi:hypothetical protein
MGLHVKRSRMEEMDCVLQEREGGEQWKDMGGAAMGGDGTGTSMGGKGSRAL